MTLTRELRTTAAFVLAVVLALTAFVWGNQRLVVHAQVVDVGQILCYVDQQGDAHDGQTGTFPVFKLTDCTSGSPIIDWCPNIDGNQTQADLPCIPPITDWCPNIPGDQTQDQLPCIPPAQPQCSDGIDNDSDGLIDFPADPGCSSASDNDESNGGNGGGGSGADLGLTKTVSNASPTPSSTVTYTITVTSSGPDSASNVKITDMLPYGVSYVSDDANLAYASTTGIWTIGTMASGTTMTLNITAMVTATSGVAVMNTATVSSDTSDPNADNNTATVSFTSTDASQGGGDTGGGSSGGGGGSHHHSSGSSSSSNNNDDQGEVLGAETECPMYLTGYIKYGADNDAGEVAKLQVFLNNFEGNALPVTGTYGSQTLAAVNAFQAKYASDVLEPWGLHGTTGYVYYTTQKEINTIYCKFQKDFPLSASQIEEIAYVRAIQPTLHAQGITSMSTGGSMSSSASMGTTQPASSAAAGTVLPNTQSTVNTTKASTTSQTAAAANASSTQGWFSKFVSWLFGR